MNKQTRKIAEGAMMCAIVGLVLFINRQLGNMLEYFMYWVLTFPILVYTAKYGVHNALVPSVSMLLLSFMISSPTTIFYLFSCIVVGLVYGGGVRKGWKNGTLLVFSGIFTFFSYLVTTVLLAAVFGYDPAEDIELVKTILELMNIHTGIDLMKTVTIIVVLVAVLMSVLQTMCIHMIGNILLSRLHIRVHPMNNILSIRASKWNGWLILVIWVLLQWKCAKIKPGSFDDTAGGLPCLQGPCNRLRSDVYHGTAGAVTKARICVAVDDCSLCALCTGCHCRNRHCGYPVSAER